MKIINHELVFVLIWALAAIQAISRDDYDRFQGLVNNLRSQYNAGPLCYNDKLMKSAKMQSVDQYNLGNMQHEGADGSSSFERAQRAGFKYPSKVSENVAAGQTSVSSVFEDWRDSPGHFRNMVDKDVNMMGLEKVGIYWTMTLGRSRGGEACLRYGRDESNVKSDSDNQKPAKSQLLPSYISTSEAKSDVRAMNSYKNDAVSSRKTYLNNISLILSSFIFLALQ